MIIASVIMALLLIPAFLIYASYSIRSGFYLRLFCRKATTEKIVALTFDDGPHPIYTTRVLSVLKEYHAPSCFFCIGQQVEGNEAILQQMVSEGHLIGNHSYSHANRFPCYSLSEMKKDLQACQSVLEHVTLHPVKLFRPPFGVTNPTIAKAVRQLNYVPIGWNIRTWDTCQRDTDKILRRVKRRLKPGSVILLHDRMPNSHLLTRQILELLKEQQYTIVRIDQMLQQR